ncbi:hypothetical protein DSM104299_02241 [Baekduia alba]|uniref:DUF427 domain-containing protein n=1 Tax=Baekduia alba TaxID=2997333 RepID=UPI0023427858|nr:DUF427 domain-containing protein [Baekduia alba]WCB93528.1 hypothetical protein DSM104299_02241 [Baekduia alba]
MTDHPQSIVETGHVAPSPRRVRGFKDGDVVFDTVRALYVWEIPHFPQYAIPLDDVDRARLEGLDHRILDEGGAAGHVRFAWDALDAWFEEDEEIFVHPRNPYARVDSIRSSRPIRVQRDGLLLAEAKASIMVFETGLPTRYYVERTALDPSHLIPSDTVTACPYKGKTSNYWSFRTDDGRVVPDIAWSYNFPTLALTPIAGLVAFYNERTDITVG